LEFKKTDDSTFLLLHVRMMRYLLPYYYKSLHKSHILVELVYIDLFVIKYFILIFFISIIPIYADESIYQLNVDNQTFEMAYSLDGQVIAMAIDHELNSLLIGITDVKDSTFQIILPQSMISAENNEFAVLVDQIEVDYNISTQDNASILQFFVPAGSEEIEIIGTHVIPEFPLGALLVLATMIVIVTLVTKTGKFRIR